VNGGSVAARELLRAQPGRVVHPPQKPQPQFAFRGLPRLYLPHDPVILVSGAGRLFKHGKDGRFSVDGTLRCRLAPSCVSALSTDAKGTKRAYFSRGAVLPVHLYNRSIPAECNALLDVRPRRRVTPEPLDKTHGQRQIKSKDADRLDRDAYKRRNRKALDQNCQHDLILRLNSSFRPDVIFGKDRHDKGASFMKISSSIG
jgi:hypothetical protein